MAGQRNIFVEDFFTMLDRAIDKVNNTTQVDQKFILITKQGGAQRAKSFESLKAALDFLNAANIGESELVGLYELGKKIELQQEKTVKWGI